MEASEGAEVKARMSDYIKTGAEIYWETDLTKNDKWIHISYLREQIQILKVKHQFSIGDALDLYSKELISLLEEKK